MLKRLLSFTSLFLVLVSCSDNNREAKTGTYLGGEIVNPTSNIVILRKDEEILDSIKLDRNNRFLYKFDMPANGIYTISHNEKQIVYIESGDSLLLRLNTYEFDETLAYSGFGAAENNLMIEFFLKNEKENDLMLQQEIYQQDPKTFSRSISKFREERKEILADFLKKHEVSSSFEKIASAIVNYDFYARKEVYPMSHFGVDRIKFLKSFPKDFYKYREEVSFNEPDLIGLYSYQRFLINYFNQAAFKEYYTQEPYNPLSFTHNLHKLRLIDTEVENDSVESFLLTRTIKDYLANSNDKKGGQTLYELYMKRISSKDDKEEIKALYMANVKIETGKRIPSERIVSLDLDTLSFDQVINKPAFIFFWTSTGKAHAQRAQKLAQSILNKYPEYTYLAINVKDELGIWQETVKRYDFDSSRQYHFADEYEELINDLALNSLLKTFIVDRNGFIINAHANIFSTNFENELLQGLNKNQPSN